MVQEFVCIAFWHHKLQYVSILTAFVKSLVDIETVIKWKLAVKAYFVLIVTDKSNQAHIMLGKHSDFRSFMNVKRKSRFGYSCCEM